MVDSPQSSDSQSNIDELVKELSRPQNPAQSSTPAPQSAPSTGVPSVPPRPTPPSSVPSTPVAPQPLSNVVKPALPATPPISSVPNVPKEYQSSIRTMTDDLAKLKAGQQPQGVTTPRKIEPPVSSVKPAPTAIPPTTPPKPAQGPTLAPMVKAAPMAPVSKSISQPTPTTIPRPTPPPSVMAPATKTPEIKTDQKNQFYVPPATTQTTSGGNKNLLFVGIGVLVVLLGGLYWYFMIRSTDQVTETPVITFTPRPSATPNPDVLGTIFHIHENKITLPASGDATTAFVNGVNSNSSIMAGTFMVTDVISGTSSSSAPLTVLGLFDRLLVNYPPELKSVLGKNFKIMVYAQTENFDSKGHLIAYDSSKTSNRLVMINEIASSSASIFQNWEPTMVSSLAGIMTVTPAKNTGPIITTVYNGTSVRFKNFPYPDHSIDYALVQYKDKTYIVIAGSREAMFGVIDTLNHSVGGGK